MESKVKNKNPEIKPMEFPDFIERELDRLHSIIHNDTLTGELKGFAISKIASIHRNYFEPRIEIRGFDDKMWMRDK